MHILTVIAYVKQPYLTKQASFGTSIRLFHLTPSLCARKRATTSNPVVDDEIDNREHASPQIQQTPPSSHSAQAQVDAPKLSARQAALSLDQRSIQQSIFAPTSQQLTEANRIFQQQCSFVTSATASSNLPEQSMAEFAFMGRSNVGKSSLLNALMRTDIVRTSKKPGHTKMMNMFRVGGAELMLVDLPGYGFRSREEWMDAMGDYFNSRNIHHLMRVCLLVDCGHGLKSSDKEAIQMLDDDRIPYQIILTKIDRVSPTRIVQAYTDISNYILAHTSTCFLRPFPVSSKSGMGIPQLRAYLFHAVTGK